MKRFLSVFLTGTIILSALYGCGSKEPAPTEAALQEETPAIVTTAPTEQQTIDTDEGLLTVTITLPESMFEGEDTSNFDADAYVAENGFIHAEVNEDGSVSVTMTKKKHSELMAELTANLEATFAEMVESEDTPYIKEITHNDDFSEVTMKVIRADYENTVFEMTPFVIGLSAMMYQAFLDVESHCEVLVVDYDTGDIINTANYPIPE